LVVADVSGNGIISSFDAAMIAKFVAGPPYASPGIGSTGTWKFLPASKNYASVTSSLTGENYSGLLMGEVSGNWTNSGARPEAAGAATSVSVNAPMIVAPTDRQIVMPVSAFDIAGLGVISYQFDLVYDSSVIHPAVVPVDLSGTISKGLSVVSNAADLGRLRVVVYGPLPIDRDGVLLNLSFTPVGKAGTVSPLRFENLQFNDQEPLPAIVGQVQLSYATQAVAEGL